VIRESTIDNNQFSVIVLQKEHFTIVYESGPFVALAPHMARKLPTVAHWTHNNKTEIKKRKKNEN